MHESGILKNIISKVEEVAAAESGASVKSITIRLGAQSNFTPEHFREHFVFDSKGTALEGVEVHVVEGADMSDRFARDIILESVELS